MSRGLFRYDEIDRIADDIPASVAAIPVNAIIPRVHVLIHQLIHFFPDDIKDEHFHVARHIHPQVHPQGLFFRVEEVLIQVKG